MKRILNSTAVLSLSLAAIIGVSEPVIAHNDDLKTSPVAGSTIEAGRIPITLSFTEELLDEDSIRHEVIITNESGAVPALCASAKGFELTSAAAIEQPGKYTVSWRTVSADGHPISGSFDFNVENNTDYDAATDAVDACVYPMLISPLETETKPAKKKLDSLDSTLTLLGIGVGGVAVLIGVVQIVRMVKKRQDQRHKNKNE